LRIPNAAPSGAAELAISIGLGRTQSKTTIFIE
jgi:hypothetical protein